MRLASTVFASLILHALLLQIPVGPSPFEKPPTSFFSDDTQMSPRVLLITLHSMIRTTDNGPSPEPGSPDQMGDKATSEISLVEEAPNDQRPSAEKTADSSGIQPLTDTPPHYYSRHEVDRPPRMADDLSEKDGPLDKALRDFDENGSVVFEIWISDKGAVEKTEIVSTNLSAAVFNTVKNNVDLARFIPARLNKQAVHSRITIEIEVRGKSEN